MWPPKNRTEARGRGVIWEDGKCSLPSPLPLSTPKPGPPSPLSETAVPLLVPLCLALQFLLSTQHIVAKIIYLKSRLPHVTLLDENLQWPLLLGPMYMIHSYSNRLHPSTHMKFLS